MAYKNSEQYLQREREVEALITEYKAEDLPARRKRDVENDLYERFYKVALKTAHKYKNNPISIEDMALAGMGEYKKALGKYDPAHEGAMKFVGYAASGIKNGIIGAVREHYGIKNNWQKHLFSNEGKYRRDAVAKYPDLPEEDIDRIVAKRFYEVAQEKGDKAQFNVHSVEQALEKLQDYKSMIAAARQIEFAASQGFEQDDEGVSAVERLVDETAMPTDVFTNQREEAGLIRSILANAFAKLDEREKRVFAERLPMYDDEGSVHTTLESLSEEFGVSRERVRQIFVRAHEKVQKSIIVQAREAGLTQIAGMNFGQMDIPAIDGKKSLYSKQVHAKPASAPAPQTEPV